MKKMISLLLAMCLVLGLTLPVLADATPITVTEIQKYGNLVLSIKGTEFLAMGYDFGDIVTVTLNGQEFDMPVGSNYADVDQGSMICRVVIKPDTNEDYMILAINMGDLATAALIAEKEKTEADPGYIWHYKVEEPVPVGFAMKEKAARDSTIADEDELAEKRASLFLNEILNLLASRYTNNAVAA